MPELGVGGTHSNRIGGQNEIEQRNLLGERPELGVRQIGVVYGNAEKPLNGFPEVMTHDT